MARIYCRQSQNGFFKSMAKSPMASETKINLRTFSILICTFVCSLISFINSFPLLLWYFQSLSSLCVALISLCLSYETKWEQKFLWVLHLLLGDLLAYFTKPYVNMKYHVMYFCTLYCISSYVENHSAFVFKSGLTVHLC